MVNSTQVHPFFSLIGISLTCTSSCPESDTRMKLIMSIPRRELDWISLSLPSCCVDFPNSRHNFLCPQWGNQINFAKVVNVQTIKKTPLHVGSFLLVLNYSNHYSPRPVKARRVTLIFE